MEKGQTVSQKTVSGILKKQSRETDCKLINEVAKVFYKVLRKHGSSTRTIKGIDFHFLSPSLYKGIYIVETGELYSIQQGRLNDYKSGTRSIDDIIGKVNGRCFGAKVINEYGGLKVISQGY
eukprot:gnl/Chilomastix_caulleri/3578.p1 GENE.gnl/Chilomastix_caulleri/3578~~gnl/Chilomastix_caulleri/3578.p1  ORF type:complete len:122 (+),score=14.85 gnl/Chilomastix_caulleri/3578:9-374(+)